MKGRNFSDRDLERHDAKRDIRREVLDGIDEIKARNYNLDFKNPHTIALAHGDPQELLAKLEQDEQKTAALRDQLKTILAEALLR